METEEDESRRFSRDRVPMEEHGRQPCSFGELVGRQRDALRQRAAALRSSVRQFGERCRDHRERAAAGPGPRTPGGPGRSESGAPWGGWAQDTAGCDWPATSDSDTDGSVIEVCAASRKARQSRGSQTKNVCSAPVGPVDATGSGPGGPRQCALKRTSVSHASTQTVRQSWDAAEVALDLLLSTTSKDKATRQRLLDALEVLAGHRPDGGKNGVHRAPLITEAGSNAVSPVDGRSDRIGSSGSCFAGALQNTGTPVGSWASSPRVSSHAVPDRHPRGRNGHACKRTDSHGTNGSQRHLMRHVLLEEVLNSYLREGDDSCGCRETPRAFRGEGERPASEEGRGCPAEDALWRLAEEGRHPWPLGGPVGRDSPGAAPCPVRLLYRDETASSLGPFRLFKPRPPRRRGRISVPPALGVILEQS